MKLLIVTQKLDKDDENLGAFYYWFELLAQKFDAVTIIASYVGKTDLPSNVKVYSLGKNLGAGRIRRIWRFWELFSRCYAECNAVFFHQIPEFVIAATPFLTSLKRTTGLWYAHKSVTWQLRWAERLVDYIFTSSPEGFRLPSKKVLVLGQAINTKRFAPVSGNNAVRGGALRMITIGRIAPVKDYETLIRACALLKTWDRPWTFSIVGGAIMPRDKEYLERLKKLVHENGLDARIHFYGARPFSEVPTLLQEHDMFLNLSRTGSLDKAVLEAMSCGLSVITANEAYQRFLPEQYFLSHMSPEFLARRIQALADENRPNMALRAIVEKEHNFERTVERIASVLASGV